MTALIRSGKLCASCQPGKCCDAPTPYSPLEIDCPHCGGRCCPLCNDEGTFPVTGCPYELVDDTMHDLLRFTDLLFRGLPPVAGGALDQESWFLEAAQLLKQELDRHIPAGLV